MLTVANYSTINTLITSCRRRLNLVNTNTISNAEIQEFLYDSLASLHELLTSRWRDYFVKKFIVSFGVNQEEYPLPADFRACTAVFLTYNQTGGLLPGQRQQLTQFNMNEFSTWPPGYFISNPWPVMYRIMGATDKGGTSIFFTPVPSTAATNACEVWYVPQWNPPPTPDTTISMVLPNGWEMWVIWDTCLGIAARMRQMEFYEMFAKERDKAEQRLVAAASIRDETAPNMVDSFAQPSMPFFRNPGTS